MLRFFTALPRGRCSSSLAHLARGSSNWVVQPHCRRTWKNPAMSSFSRIEDGLDALTLGLPIIVLDSEERENEGDFVVAAEKITPQLVHFLITHGRGQVCMPITSATAKRLDLHPMVPPRANETPNFTVPIDHGNCKTGISPF